MPSSQPAQDLQQSARSRIVAGVGSPLVDLDVVALSRRSEGTRVALIEAAAAGRDVGTASVGGVQSVVDDGRTG